MISEEILEAMCRAHDAALAVSPKIFSETNAPRLQSQTIAFSRIIFTVRTSFLGSLSLKLTHCSSQRAGKC